jgi:hypothetical protein
MRWFLAIHVDLQLPGLTLKVSASAGAGLLSAGSAGPLLLSSVPAVSAGSLALGALSAASA